VFANPRNATAGTVRQLEAEHDVAQTAWLDFFPYMLLRKRTHLLSTASPRLWTRCNAAGFKVNPKSQAGQELRRSLGSSSSSGK
jgi:NAD-dependent DNA ligase